MAVPGHAVRWAHRAIGVASLKFLLAPRQELLRCSHTTFKLSAVDIVERRRCELELLAKVAHWQAEEALQPTTPHPLSIGCIEARRAPRSLVVDADVSLGAFRNHFWHGSSIRLWRLCATQHARIHALSAMRAIALKKATLLTPQFRS